MAEKAFTGVQCPVDNKTGKATKCWPMVAAEFRLERRWTSYLLTVFLPNIILVCLSWISFLVPPYIVPGRMVLLITIVIVLFNQYSQESGKSPPSNGLKVQDCWFLGCTFFILAAILEYAACLFIKREALKLKKKIDKKSTEKSHGSKPKKSQDKIARSSPVFVIRSYLAETDYQLKKRLSQDSFYKQLAEKDIPLDTGEDYGDINDQNMEKAELLERLDGMAFRIFPLIFGVYLILFSIITFTLRYVRLD
eukprot:TRINITY_DN11226_c0_g1_i1.p1 TRINITY_DN11226_c0_g1~~TRINITY_DN11226_c0_g1_i1.p1  ORF type:complete len:279 (-),score=60.67 TRINITY_DN11226_c0_g1_i1:70-822(-)